MKSSGKHVHVKYTPSNPTIIYSKTGVCRGIPTFLIYDLKHRLWVPTIYVVLDCGYPQSMFVPTIYVLSKKKKNIENVHFLQL